MKLAFLRNCFVNRPNHGDGVRPWIMTLILGLAISVLCVPRLSADDNLSDDGDVIDMVTGDVQTLPVHHLTRVSVTNPDIADIQDAQGDKVSLLAKKSGDTVVFLWDDDGKRTIKVRVVNEDLNAVKARIQKVLEEANIIGVSLENNPDIGRVVLTGSLSKENRNRLEITMEPYNDSLLNLVKEEKNEDLVEVDMQVVEISTTLEKQLGIEWGAATTNGSGGQGGANNGIGGTNSGSVLLNYNETLTSGNGSVGDFFKVGKFNRTTPLEATVNALLQEGKARLISKPRLVVVSGKQASFLVGGEIPIETTTSNTTGNTLTQNVTYTQYGVNMTVTPTIRDGKIEVILNVDIRDIDAANASNGNVAFITRNASTNLLMDNKQTVALAGLIKYSDSVQVTEVPFLSKIPILGALFRNHSEPDDSNTEMVIILTPTVLTEKKYAQNEVVMPTPAENEASKDINSRYPHAPITSNWPSPKVAAVYTHNPPSDLSVLDTYARMVQVKISKSISYPEALGAGGLAGTVKLKLHILKNGSLDSEEVVESSGNDTLDQDAIQAARTAAPFDAFSSGMDQDDMIFTIPIVYNKLIPGGQVPTQKVIASY